MDKIVAKSFDIFFRNSKNAAISGMWLANITKGNAIDKNDKTELNEIFIASLRKVVFKLFSGQEKAITTNGAIISISPDIKLMNKISLDLRETTKGEIKNDIYNYLLKVLPTIGNSTDSDGYYQFDVFSSFYNSWINFYDKIELYYFLDPVKRYNGAYWKFYIEDLKLDGSSGVLNDETSLSYDSTPGLINNDLNLYYNRLSLDFINNNVTKQIFKVDFTEQINDLNSF